MMNTNLIANAVLQLTPAQSKPSRDSFDFQALSTLEDWIDNDLQRIVNENVDWHTVNHNREKFGR